MEQGWNNPLQLREKNIGKKLKRNKDLKSALVGQTTYEFAALPDQPNADKRFLDVYSPIKINNKIVGAYEVYAPINTVTHSLERLYVTITLLLAASLLLLWLALNGLVRRASKTISQQNTDLHELTDELSTSLNDLQKNYLGTMESLASAVEARDPDTKSHSTRLEVLAETLGQTLHLSTEQKLHVKYAYALHDIGKIGIPEAILLKPGPLNPEEWQIMKTHALIGARIVAKIPFLKDLTSIVKHHHERFDGGGYPDGLVGKRIPVESRILTVVDAFDAMTSDRPYRKALSTKEAIAQLLVANGTQFDPIVVDAFLRLREERSDLFADEEAA